MNQTSGNLHYLRGGAAKKPAVQHETGAPCPDTALPDAPDFLNDVARAEWDRIGKELLALGLVSKLDMTSLALYCVAFSRWAWAEAKMSSLAMDEAEAEAIGKETPTECGGMITKTPNGYKQLSVWMIVSNKAQEQLAKYSDEFGLSPAKRGKVTAGDPVAQLDMFANDNNSDTANGADSNSGATGQNGRPANPADYLSH